MNCSGQNNKLYPFPTTLNTMNMLFVAGNQKQLAATTDFPNGLINRFWFKKNDDQSTNHALVILCGHFYHFSHIN
jgi:hypothetical protein